MRWFENTHEYPHVPRGVTCVGSVCVAHVQYMYTVLR